jgi:hypothetical protein
MAPERLASQPTNSWVLRIYAPLILSVGFAGILGKNRFSVRALFFSPIFLCAFFMFSLAVVQLRAGTLRYRRFLTWHKIEPQAVRSCGVVWPGLVGYIRLKPFVWPWGRVYFVLDGNPPDDPWRSYDSQILRYLQKI